MFPILQLGPLAIQVPGLVLLAGIWFGLSLAERYARKHRIDPEALYNLIFTALVAGVVSARLVYAARFPAAFAASPRSLISLNPGLLDLWGGAAGAFIAALIYGQRKALPLLPLLDALTPFFAVFTLAIGLSNLASGSAFGAPSDLPWAIDIWGARRHPSQIYASLAAAAVLILLWPGRKFLTALNSGAYFSLFFTATATCRLFLETFRGDSLLLAGGIRMVQVLAWTAAAIGLWGWWTLQQRPSESETKTTKRKNS